MTTRGVINSNFYQIVTVDANGNPTQVKPEYIGNVGNANYANFANSANFANVANTANIANTASVANSVNVANVVGIGNIATLNLTGSSSNILYGNGVFAPIASAPVANANYANYAGNAFSVTGSNVVGDVAGADHANVADLSYSVDVANVVGIGNIATINLDGNVSNVLLGDGTFGPGGGGGNTANANYANFAGEAFSVTGSNVTGEVANANYASYAGNALSVDGANVVGDVAGANHANIADTANSVAVANVVGIGNIATVNLDGSTSNVLYGNGVFSAINITSVANANYANYAGNAFSVDGANVVGDVSGANHANIADTANSVAVANVVGIGNIATSNFDGNSSNALLGNGVFGPVTVSSVANANYANFAGQVVDNTQSNITLVGTLANLSVLGNVTANAYQLTTSPGTLTASTGQMVWSAQEQTMNLGMNYGVTQQVGLENYVLVKASASITNGQVVMFTGANGDNILAAPANAASAGFKADYIIGVATQDIANNDFGYITVFGMVHDLNTLAYTVGDILWYDPTSTTGGMTATQPTDPNFQIQIAAVTKRSGGDGHIQVRISVVSTLNLLTDVTITSPTTGQALIYNGGNVWVNGNSAYANTAGTVTANAQPNITSTGVLTSLSVLGNITAGNANLGNLAISNYFSGNGSLLTGVTATATPAGANTQVQFNDAGVTGANASLTFNKTTGTVTTSILSTTGNVSANILVSRVATGTAPITVTSTTLVPNLFVARSNISDNSNLISTTTGTYYLNFSNNTTTAQLRFDSSAGGPNYRADTNTIGVAEINATLVGTAGGTTLVNVQGSNINFDAGGVRKLTVTSTLITANTAFSVVGNVNASNVIAGVITSNVAVGTAPFTVTSTTQVANLRAQFSGTSNTANSVAVANVVGIGNIATSNFDGNASNALLGNGVFGPITVGTVANANYAAYAGNITIAAQPNITSTGTLVSLSVTGNVNAGNIIASTITSNVVTGTAPFTVTSTTEVSNLTVAFSNIANIANSVAVANVVGIGNIATSNFDGNGSNALLGNGIFGAVTVSSVANANYAAYAGNVTIAAQPNITSTGTLASLSVTGNITTANKFNGDGGGLSNLQIANLSGTLTSLYVDTGTVTSNGFYALQLNQTWNNATAQMSVAEVVVTDTASAANSLLYSGNVNGSVVFSVNKSGNIVSTGTGNVANVLFTKYNETVVSGGSVSGTLTPNAAAGTIYNYTLTGNVTISTLANAVAGTGMTLILTQGGSGSYTLTSTMKFLGGAKTLSTAVGAIDIMSVFYDGSTYYASLGKGFA